MVSKRISAHAVGTMSAVAWAAWVDADLRAREHESRWAMLPVEGTILDRDDREHPNAMPGEPTPIGALTYDPADYCPTYAGRASK